MQEEKQRKLLRVRLDMAKFLQETLRESGLKANSHIVGTEAFKEFFRKVPFNFSDYTYDKTHKSRFVQPANHHQRQILSM